MVAETPSPPEQKQKQPSADRSKSGLRRWTAMVLLIRVVLLALRVQKSSTIRAA